MADVVIRDWLESELRAILPKRYVIIPTARTVDAIVKPTVILKQERIGRQIIDGRTVPGGRMVGMTITIAVPYQETGAAEKALDDDLVAILDAIDAMENVRWTTAEKKIWSPINTEPCYDIAIEVPYKHTKKE